MSPGRADLPAIPGAGLGTPLRRGRRGPGQRGVSGGHAGDDRGIPGGVASMST